MIRRSDDQILGRVPEMLALANEWLKFVHEPNPVAEDDLLRLESILDKLSVVRYELGPIVGLKFEDVDTDPPRGDQSELRDRISKRFPMLGFYYIPEAVTTDFLKTGLHLGDAIDDILDITRELSDVVWLIEQERPIKACWDFGFGYDHHWRYHLRSLLWYLEMRRFETL
jgi:hypothetical protein